MASTRPSRSVFSPNSSAQPISSPFPHHPLTPHAAAQFGRHLHAELGSPPFRKCRLSVPSPFQSDKGLLIRPFLIQQAVRLGEGLGRRPRRCETRGYTGPAGQDGGLEQGVLGQGF